MADSLTAKVCGIDGKYTFINKGKADGVQVGDVFDSGSYTVLVDPDTKEVISDEAYSVYAELYVERVFDHYSATVPLYEITADYFHKGDEVARGHTHRVTPFLGLLNTPGRTG